MIPEIWSIIDRTLFYFLRFYPSNNWENQNFRKTKKNPRDIVLQMRTLDDNHMMYGSWDIVHGRHNFCNTSFSHSLFFFNSIKVYLWKCQKSMFLRICLLIIFQNSNSNREFQKEQNVSTKWLCWTLNISLLGYLM